jgi:hypothetical protein
MCVSSVDTSVLMYAHVVDLPTYQSAKKGASAYIMSLFRGAKHKSTVFPRSEQTETSSAYEDAQVFIECDLYRMCPP